MRRVFNVLLLLLGTISLTACGMSTFNNGAVNEGVETVVVPYMLTMNTAEELPLVQEEVNKITREKIGVEVDLLPIDFASWNEQMNLLLINGSVDLFNCCFMPSLSSYVNSGAVTPLDGLLEKYGDGISEMLGDYIGVGRYEGNIYGIPNIDAYGNRAMVIMNADICDELGILPTDIHDFDDLTEAARKVKKAYPELAVFPTGVNGAFLNLVEFDSLGTDSDAILGGLVLAEQDYKVVNIYETEEFEKLLSYTWLWEDEDFYISDPINSQNSPVSYLSERQAFAVVTTGFDEDVLAEMQQNNSGIRLYGSELESTNYITTDDVLDMMWCISSLSEHKEASMKLLNELYTNAELANLLCNGIEGKHYVQNGDGTITFPDDLNAATTGWPSGMGTFWPNITITYPWEPNSADYYETWLESNSIAVKSKALGFTFDSSNVEDEVAACTNVVNQYYNSLVLGIGDRESQLAEFRKALRKNGIDEIITEKQKQLNEWVRNNKS